MHKFAKRVIVAVCATLSIPCVSLASTSAYTVHSGQSLWGIAQSHGTSVQEIMRLNHLHSMSLAVGQALVLPSGVGPSKVVPSGASHVNPPSKPNTKPTTPSSKSHPSKTVSQGSNVYATVHSGDTLSALAHHYHVSLSGLEKWNGLTSKSVLHIGQHLKVGETSGVDSSLSGRSGGVAGLGGDVFGSKLADFAQQFVGTPYQWGGRSAHGFDCSGFVQYVFGHFGIALPRTSYDMFGVGSAVSQSDLMPGDLIFSDTYGGGASHVGIYLGGGKFISAESGGVAIASLSQSYWARHYVGAKHVGK